MNTSTLKLALKRGLFWLFKRAGVTFLSKQETLLLLLPYQQKQQPGASIALPAVHDCHDLQKLLFEGEAAVIEPCYSWRFQSGNKKVSVQRCGAVFTGGKLLQTDFENLSFLKDLFKARRAVVKNMAAVIAPFGHDQDGVAFGGYYDFMVLVAAKLCRLERDMPDTFAAAGLTYPLFGTSYEQELLACLGFGPERIFDSRQHRVVADTYLLGNSGHWFYPNVSDVEALRQRLLPSVPPTDTAPKRIYVSRTGRRRILNEDALINTLEKYGFAVVEDKPRGLAEQLSLYHGASFIMGSHGASFTNIIWSRPGTQLLELFSPLYAPGHFRYLAHVGGLNYSAYCQGPLRYQVGRVSARDLSENFSVSVSDLERSLNQLISQQSLTLQA